MEAPPESAGTLFDSAPDLTILDEATRAEIGKEAVAHFRQHYPDAAADPAPPVDQAIAASDAQPDTEASA